MDVFLYNDEGNDVILSDPLESRGGGVTPWEIIGVGGIVSMEMFGFPYIYRIGGQGQAKKPGTERFVINNIGCEAGQFVQNNAGKR